MLLNLLIQRTFFDAAISCQHLQMEGYTLIAFPRLSLLAMLMIGNIIISTGMDA